MAVPMRGPQWACQWPRMLPLVWAMAWADRTATGPEVSRGSHIHMHDTALKATPCGNDATVLRVMASTCAHTGDCRDTIARAVAECNATNAPCEVRLESGATFPVRCPSGAGIDRPSFAQWEHPAVDLSGTVGLCFGGGLLGSGPAAILTVDYASGGCAAISADRAANLTLQNVALDTVRLPYTVGRVVTNMDNGLAVTLALETEAGHDVYAWDEDRYPWLTQVMDNTTAAVAVGARATRQLKRLNLEGFSSTSVHRTDKNSVTLKYDGPDPVRGAVATGTRVFLKHFANTQSWGVYGWKIQGHFTLQGVSLWACGGMGLRCDFCDGVFRIESSTVGKRPGTVRPMSTTADASHAMHHRGAVELVDSRFEWQGDDGFNVHGNFIVMSAINGNQATYINEGGAGWVGSSPTMMVGDAVEFYSRGNLGVLGRGTITSATNSTVTFASAIPPGVALYDMFLSTTRVSSLTATGCFFGNSNARGMVISAIGVTITNCTFANLTLTAVLFAEGGCGAEAGDYTEGPFSSNVLIQNNRFVDANTIDQESSTAINNHGMIQVCACVPLNSVCGRSGSGVAATAIWNPSARSADKAPISGAVYAASVALPGAVHVTHLEYFLPCGPSNGGSGGFTVGLYGATDDGVRPTLRLGQARFDMIHRPSCTDSPTGPTPNGTWVTAALPTPIDLATGSYFLASTWDHGAPWRTVPVPGVSLILRNGAGGGGGGTPATLPSMLSNDGQWSKTGQWTLPLRAVWTPLTPWCELNATQAPYEFRGENGHQNAIRITELGQFAVDRMMYRNVTVQSNTFEGPPEWVNPFVHVGSVDGLTIVGNTMNRRKGLASPSVPALPADIVMYSSAHQDLGHNACANEQSCIIKD